MDMIFKTPIFLVLIPIIPALMWLWHRRQRPSSVRFSSIAILPDHKKSLRVRLKQLPLLLKLTALIMFLAALAGPRSVFDFTEVQTEGIDIVLATDVSGSMAAEDFKLKGERRNRLDVVKEVMKEFVEARGNDRLGIVAFAKEAYTVSPLTTDQDWLLMNLDRLRMGLIEDGTAVGSGLSSALARLKNSDAKSKVVILLTDGVNNAGKVQPLEAAEIASAMGIKVYTIGAGTRGPVPFPVQDIWGRKQYQTVQINIDEETLGKIASVTGGQYFRADNTEALREIYQSIDRMEKTKIQQYGYREYKELFPFFIFAGLTLLFVELILKNTWLMVLP